MKWLCLVAFAVSTSAFAGVSGTCELKYNGIVEIEPHRTFSECMERAEYLIDLKANNSLIKKVTFKFSSGLINSSGDVKSAR